MTHARIPDFTVPLGLPMPRFIGEYAWKDTGGAWPNLLRSAATVSGVPLADIEHERASRRGPARG